MSSENILPLIVATPAVGAIAINIFNKSQEEAMRMFAIAVSAVTFFLTLLVWRDFDPANPGMQMVFTMDWIPNWNIFLKMGVDGISLPLVMLTSRPRAPLIVCSRSGLEVACWAACRAR